MAQFLIPVFTDQFRKQLQRLDKIHRDKFTKKLPILLSNPHHPSFRVKMMSGLDRFEARLSYQYRFTFIIVEKELWLLSIGSHDTGLGKK